MDNSALKRGKEIEQKVQCINYDLDQLRDTEYNPRGSDISYYGSHISPKATEQIRTIAINSLVSRRRSLQREFKNL